MSATAKFYTAFFIALAVVIGASYYVGYRAGIRHERAISHVLRVPTYPRAP